MFDISPNGVGEKAIPKFYLRVLFNGRSSKELRGIQTCSRRQILVTTRLSGIMSSNTATPASTDTPMTSYKKYVAMVICKGADHIRFRLVISSISRCASTDIRLTISPAVVCLRAQLFSLIAWGDTEVIQIFNILMDTERCCDLPKNNKKNANCWKT